MPRRFTELWFNAGVESKDDVLSNWNAEGYLQVTNAHEVTRATWDAVPQNSFWNKGIERESGRHRIHPYPAKFPAFIASKAFGIARERTSKLRRVADVFCGCGTVAFEARREGLDFWGCDINPVATLIARTKRGHFNTRLLEQYRDAIMGAFDDGCAEVSVDAVADARLQYWYEAADKENLARLLLAIRTAVPSRSRYRDFFLCAYSAILKATSRWLTKSIKPQIDPHKKPTEVRAAFVTQTSSMIKAFGESAHYSPHPSQIVTGSVLKGPLPKDIDLIVTSPPYVTSYEYADLHQLSSLWLGFASDYRTLREGSIGSSQHALDFDREIKRLNQTGGRVVFSLFDQDRAIARAVANYYLDMQKVAQRCKGMLRRNGLAIFVIGDTEYKGVKIENALHLTEALLEAGFASVKVSKRAVSGKILTPYRTPEGRFTRSTTGRHVYSEEFVLLAER